MSKRNSKVYDRSIAGLVDALFDQLQDIRDGISTPQEAEVFAKNAETIIRAIEANQREREYIAQSLLEQRIEALEERRKDNGQKALHMLQS